MCGSVDAGRVPDTFRHLFRSEVEGRGEPVLESFVLERWTASEPTPFVISESSEDSTRYPDCKAYRRWGEKDSAAQGADCQKKEIDPVRQSFCAISVGTIAGIYRRVV